MTARWKVTAMAWTTAALLAGHSAGAAAQRPDAARGRIAGAVVDAVGGHAIAGATVVLQPDVAGVFPGPSSGSGFAASGLTTMSDSTGAYHFDGLPPGVYRVYVSRYSYRPYAVTIELRAGAEPAVSIGLRAEPIALEPVAGRSAAPPLFRVLDAGGATAENRLLAVALRRRRFLTTDVRELTDADVSEAVTLGEPDVLRALQRLPGVAAPSDYSAELWTRGGPWSHTRVYFDGVPLFNPLHALGVLSGVGSGALGAVWFHPGTRSAGIGEGAAGVVDLQSRRAMGTGELNVQGDLSLMSAGVALDQRVADGRAGWMLAGRRTYLDWLSDLSRRATGSGGDFPYGFRELTGRIDARTGASSTVEASGLWEADRLTRGDDAGPDPIRTDWGNSVGRVALTTRLGGLNARHAVGASRHHGVTVADSGGILFDLPWDRSTTDVGYAGFSGSFWPDATTVAGPAWTVGYALERHTAEYAGPMPLPVPTADFAARPEDRAGDAPLWTGWSADLPVAVLWGERTWAPDERMSLRAGVRLEGGPEVRDAGPLRVSPRLAARLAATPEVALSAGYARVFQYTQALAPAGVHLASLASGDAWLVAGAGVPVLRADLLTFGMEGWLEPGRVIAVNWFGRRTTGLALTDPRPGPVFGRSALLSGESLAYGIEASVRQVVGPITGSAGYTVSRARTAAVGLEFASGSDRTHVLDATLMVRALPSLRLGAAFTGATGAPYTRMVADSAGCLAEPGCDPAQLPWATAPNAQRGPAFASLDLLADWSTAVRGAEIGFYAQLRNALGRENATVYVGGGPGCLPEGCDDESLHNAFERGLPRLAVLGFRVRR
ncbi:MAG TPA: TonB-dependent receptor [Longimicrobiales bacterium]|nr:TonB-dependent receptor [Longimicrobiales bacterium]